MDHLWLIIVAVAGGGIIGVLAALRPLRRFSKQVHLERARESFRLQREGLESRFMAAARATGKPRGLTWKDCQFNSEVEFVRDKANGDIAALVGVIIAFEAIEGSDMENNTNVANLRNASAVFYFHKGHWNTVGKALFNMNPAEAIDHFKNQYEPTGSYYVPGPGSVGLQ